MFSIEMLPAGPGDCLWIEYGDRTAPNIIIVDGGDKGGGSVLLDRIERARKFRGVRSLNIELLVVTHLDNDHIVGIVELLADRPPVTFRDIWFNGEKHVSTLLGGGESTALSELLTNDGLPWNCVTKHGPISLPARGKPKSTILRDDLRMTILGPTLKRLRDLETYWPNLAQRLPPAGFNRADLLGRSDTWPPKLGKLPARDDSAANGSSIVLLAEFDGASILLTGDAFGNDLLEAIKRLPKRNGPLPLRALKVPHHGAAANYDSQFYASIDCSTYLISTDGSRHKHPDHQALLRILQQSERSPILVFNYRSEQNKMWAEGPEAAHVQRGFRTRYPRSNSRGTTVQLT